MIKKIGFVIEFSMYSILSIAQNFGSWFCNSLLNIFVFSEKKDQLPQNNIIKSQKASVQIHKRRNWCLGQKNTNQDFWPFRAIGFWWYFVCFNVVLLCIVLSCFLLVVLCCIALFFVVVLLCHVVLFCCVMLFCFVVSCCFALFFVVVLCCFVLLCRVVLFCFVVSCCFVLLCRVVLFSRKTETRSCGQARGTAASSTELFCFSNTSLHICTWCTSLHIYTWLSGMYGMFI